MTDLATTKAATVRGGGGGFRAVCNECHWLAPLVHDATATTGARVAAQADAAKHNQAAHAS